MWICDLEEAIQHLPEKHRNACFDRVFAGYHVIVFRHEHNLDVVYHTDTKEVEEVQL